MPIQDIVDVEAVLAPRAGARASLGIGQILHTLTDDQDAAFGTDYQIKIFEATWQDALAALGIAVGDLAYEDVRAHFSQSLRPEFCYLGRRGEATGTQVRTLTIADAGGGNAADGLYELRDIEGGPYAYTASGETPTQVRDALIALVTAGTHPSFTEASSGADAITFTAANPGVNIPMTLVAPTGGATLVVTATAKVLKRALVRTLTFPTGDDGLYEVTVQTSTGQKSYQWTEASGTGTGADQAAAFKALFDADPSDLVVAPLPAPVGGTVTLTAATAGVPFVITATTPNSDTTQASTTENRNISDDIARAIDAGGWYYLINGSRDAIDIEQGAEAINPERHGHIVQSSDAAIRTTATTDVFSKLKAASRGRTLGVEHPVNAEGVHAALAGDVSVDQPGQVTWNAIELTGFSGQNFPLQSEAANIRGKEGGYLERYDARSQDIFIGGYGFDGRPFDLYRALDTFCANVETALFDLLVVNRIVPYDDDGIAQAEAAILTEWDRAVSTGYGVTLNLVRPEITDADPDEQVRGIQPLFEGQAVFQVGTYKLRASFTVSQEQQ